jgi:hypothetical protein
MLISLNRSTICARWAALKSLQARPTAILVMKGKSKVWRTAGSSSR